MAHRLDCPVSTSLSVMNSLIPLKLRRTSIFLAIIALSSWSSASVESTIGKARAHIGTESALAGLTSVHFTGQLSTTEITPDGPQDIRADLEIVFQSPYRQSIVATTANRIETTALDDYEGWQRIADPASPNNWRLTLLSVDQIKRLRANTWENLSFFRGIERRGGRTEDLGLTQIDGRTAHKIGFVHEAGIIFYRYFDVDTGKLLLTETEAGGSIREEGEIVVDGIRFPKRVITTNELADGSKRTVTVTFDKVEVNQAFPASTFAVPPMTPGGF